jgi:Domain of unknown function (DUF4112)
MSNKSWNDWLSKRVATGRQNTFPNSPDERRRRARSRLVALAHLMDSAIALPGIRGGVGLDAVLGVVPVAGDAVSALIGVYSIFLARELGASRWLQARMVGNLLVDAALGAVPIAGDVADVFFRAHRRNLRLLQRELKEPWIEAEAVREIEGELVAVSR